MNDMSYAFNKLCDCNIGRTRGWCWTLVTVGEKSDVGPYLCVCMQNQNSGGILPPFAGVKLWTWCASRIGGFTSDFPNTSKNTWTYKNNIGKHKKRQLKSVSLPSVWPSFFMYLFPDFGFDFLFWARRGCRIWESVRQFLSFCWYGCAPLFIRLNILEPLFRFL